MLLKCHSFGVSLAATDIILFAFKILAIKNRHGCGWGVKHLDNEVGQTMEQRDSQVRQWSKVTPALDNGVA